MKVKVSTLLVKCYLAQGKNKMTFNIERDCKNFEELTMSCLLNKKFSDKTTDLRCSVLGRKCVHV